MPTLLTAAMLVLSLACSLVWGRPPVKSQNGDTAVPPSAEQRDNETISGFLPDTSGMEANLASTLCSGLWTNSTLECCFPPRPQPGTSSRSEKQLTQAGKLRGDSQPKPRGKNKLTESGKLGIPPAENDSDSESNDTPRPSDFLQPPLFGAGKMRAFKQGSDFYQQGPLFLP